jgi:hypothetical protein
MFNMKYQLHFTFPTFQTGHDGYTPIQEDYSYWVPLMKHFIEKSDTVEIHCWNDEDEVIKETKALVKELPKLPEDMTLTIFRGKLTDDISHYLLYNHIAETKNIKWFSIFLSKGDTTVFHSEHWGTEFFAPNLSQEEITYITSVMPKDTNFHQYV